MLGAGSTEGPHFSFVAIAVEVVFFFTLSIQAFIGILYSEFFTAGNEIVTGIRYSKEGLGRKCEDQTNFSGWARGEGHGLSEPHTPSNITSPCDWNSFWFFTVPV